MNSFPAVQYLYNLGRLIPTSTACVERLFSLMNRLCTPSRNRLSVGTLDALIRLNMEDADLSPRDIQNIIDTFAAKKREIVL